MPKVMTPEAAGAEGGDGRVVGVQHRDRRRRQLGHHPRPERRRGARARRSGRAGRGRGSSAPAPGAAAGGPPRRAPPRRPRTGRPRAPGVRPWASRSAVATPDSRLAPEVLATRSQPASRAQEATRRAVVVLPLVAEISGHAARQRAAQLGERLGPHPQQHLARQAGAAAAPQASREPPGGARECHGGGGHPRIVAAPSGGPAGSQRAVGPADQHIGEGDAEEAVVHHPGLGAHPRRPRRPSRPRPAGGGRGSRGRRRWRPAGGRARGRRARCATLPAPNGIDGHRQRAPVVEGRHHLRPVHQHQEARRRRPPRCARAPGPRRPP